MSEERIDIVVTDKVDPNVAKKIEQIATSAEKAESYLDRLKTALAAVNTSAVDRLASAMAKADSAQAKLLNSQARLTSAQNQGSVAAQKAALAQQKIATETARTQAAQARAAAATSASESAALRLAAAQQRAQATASAAATAESAFANSVDGMRAKVAAGEGGIRGLVAELQRVQGAANSADAALATVGNGAVRVNNAAGQTTRAARQTMAANANIIAQIQDIGVSLAGGQNPLLVAIQQGSQLSYIASTMEGGVGALIRSVGRLALAWAPVIATLGLVYGALNLVTDRLNDNSGIDNYIKSLGLTDKELKKLKDTHITVTDVIAATWDVLSQNLLSSMGYTTEEIKSFWSDAMDKLLYYSTAAFVGIGALTKTLLKVIFAAGTNVVKLVANAIIGVVNAIVMAVTGIINTAIDGLNALAKAANWVGEKAGIGEVFGQLEHVDSGVKSLTQGMMEMSKVDPFEEFKASGRQALKTLSDIGLAAEGRAKARIKKQADDIIGDRTPKRGRKGREDHTAENRAHAIDMVNLKLDDEMKRMQMLRGEREVQQRMDTIEEGLAQKKIKLNDEERASILAKVQAAEAFKVVQTEMDRIYDEATGPLIKMNASIDAATILYDKGKISLEQYTAELQKATRAYEEATDPLFKFKEALDQQTRLLGKYGVELEKANYLESIRQEYQTRGLSIYDESTGKLKAEVAALVAKNDALRQQQYIQSQAAGFIEPALDQARFLENYSSIYAEIDRMRQTDLEHEGAYQQALYALQAKYNEMRLSGASDFFGALADVTKNGTGAIGAISKAAAVAQATIDGYVAVQKALASAPPPWNYVAAAAVAIKTGAQVAGIVSTNAGSFATGGQFMVDGKSGVDANNINMNVTRGERVTIETPAQQRANDAAGQSKVEVHPPKVVNLFDERSFIGAMDSEHGEEVILNIIRRRSADTNQILGKN